MKFSKKRFMMWLTAALALALAVGLGINATAAGVLTKDQISGIVDTQTDETQITNPIIEVAKSARQSVVGVNNYQTRSSTFYGYGFGYSAPPAEPTLAGTGSGVVVSTYGHVLTNNHVIQNAARVTVTSEGKEYTAAVMATDPELDIAVLQVPDLNLPAVPLGDSDKLQIGEWAIVIGNPLGEEFERTVTLGVVSALDREVKDSAVDRYGRRYAKTNQMIQVDAAISSGNSGGGMFNVMGQLQGIPTLKYDSSNRSGSFFFGQLQQGPSIDNIGMCVPINAAKPLLQAVLEDYTGDAEVAKTPDQDSSDNEKPMIGVMIGTLSPNLSLMADRTLPQGAYVSSVLENSPAEEAGMLAGDIVVEANGEIIANSTALQRVIQQAQRGDIIKLKVYRAENLSDILNNKADRSTLGEGKYVELEVTPKFPEHSM